MAVLVWDKVGERTYQSGIDHGVLYLEDGTVAVWNGLVDVEESSSNELKSFFLDGVKYLENLTPGDYVGKLKAFTYPEIFDVVNGIAHVAPGMSAYEQQPKSFNLSYRTKIGNDIDGQDYGYKIHLLYDLLATPDAMVFTTLQDTAVAPIMFSWGLTGTPQKINKLRPTMHVSIDSRTTPPEILTVIENKLYGTEVTSPSFPSIAEIGEYFGYRGALLIIDMGDGSWMALDESDTYINMLDDTTFEIVGADATFIDLESYTISSTNVGVLD